MQGIAAKVRRRLAAAALVVAGTAGTLLALDAVCPPDLSRLGDLSTIVEDRDGTMLRAFLNSGGRWRMRTRVADVPPYYVAALKAYEDRRFDAHVGVDPIAILRAVFQNVAAGRVVSGASTLTMQVARLLEPRPRTLPSKLIEAARALQLEWRFSKGEILDMYLTLAPFGGPVEGVRAASWRMFGKSPRMLTPAEAALLVALPQQPSRLRPDRSPERATAARNKVLDRVASAIGPAVAAEAREQPVLAARHPLPMRAPHLAAALHRAAPERRLIQTTIDGGLQGALEALLARELPRFGEHGSVAVLVVDNADRTIVGHVGGLDPFDARRAGYVNLAEAPRSPGSVLKPFVYGLGFDERLIHPETVIADVPTRFGDYNPDNFDGTFSGDLTVREALQRSLNIPAVAVLQELGTIRFTHALRQAGARLVFPRGGGRPGLPVVLGGVAISLRDVVMLYAGLARGGEVAPLRTEADASTDAIRFLSPAAAAQVTGILRGTPPPPGVAQMFSRRILGIAYKTGTSYGFRDSWAVGYTRGHTVGVWVGRPDGTPMPGHFGRQTAAPLLFRIFDLLPEGPAPVLASATAAAQAPPALRRFSAGSALRRPGGAAEPDRLQILFPPSGATLDRSAEPGDGVPLRAEGGQRPLRWLVNGRPVESAAYRRDTIWRPDGSGYFKATVVDARGRGASVEFRVR